MFRLRKTVGISCAACLCLVLAGCGGDTIEKSPTSPVSGKVTLDGEPLVNVTVTFVPSGGGKIATGKTDSDGMYTLTPYEEGDGAIPGSCKIWISGALPTAALDAEKKRMMDETGIDKFDEDTDTANGPSVVPLKFTKVDTSGLTATVSESDNTIPLELGSGG
mgnify:CR=1 FL=1